MAPNYKDMASFHCKSERTIRRWEIDRPELFQIMLDEYNQKSGESTNNDTKGIIIAAVSAKGGVGKSTLSEALAVYLGSSSNAPENSDAVLLNLDTAQRAVNSNASYTLDYIDYSDKYTVSEMIDDLASRFRFVIVDTPGDATSEVLEAMFKATKLIIPMTIGRRTREATESTLNTFFGVGTDLSGQYDVLFVFNNYADRKKRDEAARLFKDVYAEFKADPKIKLRPKLASMDMSNAISTAEESGKSVFQLYRENRGAYESAVNKLSNLCGIAEEHFELQ